jgi:hypothetical protein
MKIKDLLLTMLVASGASYVTVQFAGGARELDPVALDSLAGQLAQHEAFSIESTPPGIRFTAESEEDAWLMGMGTDGLPRPGPADDVKSLVEAENSVCFITEVEFMGMNDASDQLACRVSVDEFTGFWEVHAVQGDGTDASVRCNASCLVIE